MNNDQEPLIRELHIRPTYSVLVKQRQQGKARTVKSIENDKNLKANKLTGELSKKAVRRLRNSIDWLVSSATKKFVFDKSSGKRYSFKVNFLTLTLPTTDHEISDHFFKKTLLNSFIQTCRFKYKMSNYVWKVESQDNGNIHAHFVTDVFIHWLDLRNTWNQVLKNHGVMQLYTNKYSKMSLYDYAKQYQLSNDVTMEVIERRYNEGQKGNWESPNTTDVHSVFRVKNLGAYLATYMSKKEEGRRKIKGRLWGCSHSLSESNKLMIELCGNDDNDLLDSLFSPEIEFKTITSENSLGVKKIVGDLFLYNLNDWGKVIKGRLLDLYNEHRFNIRHSLQGILQKVYEVESLMQPIELTPYQAAVYGKQGEINF